MIGAYHTRIASIGEAFAQMRCRPDYDTSRPCVEYYRTRHDMYVMVPIVLTDQSRSALFQSSSTGG
jgi:hypothetical protein